jgi:prepilin-type N-terminal cleavage/methylation domain-containing protein
MKSRNGFTLPELLVVVAVVAILATVAAPNFASVIQNSKVKKTTDFITQLTNTARSEALNRNTDVYLSIQAVPAASFCLSTTSVSSGGHSCDIRSDLISAGTTVSLPVAEIKFDRIYGVPATATTFTVVNGTYRKTVNLNMLGLVTIGG